MHSLDRRFGCRVPLEMFLNEYVKDRAHRALTANISESGIYLNRVAALSEASSAIVGLEFELPGTGETIWASGQVCHDSVDEYFHGQGVRFVGIARMHARLLRDYCIERRSSKLRELLRRLRINRYH
ncbi:MAG: PilZ domain-containing protein [Pseudomonadota bacterium]